MTTATPNTRKIRILIISMGGERQAAIERMFAAYEEDFDPPTFVPGVPSRALRKRSEFYRIAFEVGLIPLQEWEAIQKGFIDPLYQKHPNQFNECLNDVPITTENRRGSESDLKLHYSVEFWNKAKALNRGRSVLGCLLAHMMAMKQMAESQQGDEDTGFDLICEDNVRLCDDSARRIREMKEASSSAGSQQDCHLKYYGWLGSLPNIEWVLNTHSKRKGLPDDAGNKAFYFPVAADFDDLPETVEEAKTEPPDTKKKSASSKKESPATAHTTPGGTAIWGAYAYWVSKQGHAALLERLKNDVGAMLWKGKRMRCYVVKPIDKVLPRQIIETFDDGDNDSGRKTIHVTRQPALFRAPMLTSKIHAQWDPEFCKSTLYQLSQTNLSWSNLWLTELEREIVSHYEVTGDWCTVAEITGEEVVQADDNRR